MTNGGEMNAEVQVESTYNDKRKPAEIKQSELLTKVQDVRLQRRSKKFGVGGGGGSRPLSLDGVIPAAWRPGRRVPTTTPCHRHQPLRLCRRSDIRHSDTRHARIVNRNDVSNSSVDKRRSRHRRGEQIDMCTALAAERS